MNHAGEIDAADAAGAPARRGHHHRRAGASRVLRLGRGHRRRQGRDLRRARARRHGGPQPRQSPVRPASRSAARAPASQRIVRFGETCRGRRAADRSWRCSRTARRGTARILGARRHLQGRRAGTCRDELAGGAGGGDARRRRPARSRRWRSPVSQPPTGRGTRIALESRRQARCWSTKATTPIRPR